MEKKKRIGTYLRSSVVAGESYGSYVPKLLPPEPPLDMRELYSLLDQANAALGRFEGMSAIRSLYTESILIFSTGAPNRFLSLLPMWILFPVFKYVRIFV